MVFSKRSVNSLVDFVRFENYYVQQLKEEGKLLTKI